MSIRIVVETIDVQVKSGTNARGPWQIREQEVWAYFFNREGKPHAHPSRCVVNLADDQQPYPVGDYTLSPTSFFGGKYNSIMFSPRLIPARAPVSKAA